MEKKKTRRGGHQEAADSLSIQWTFGYISAEQVIGPNLNGLQLISSLLGNKSNVLGDFHRSSPVSNGVSNSIRGVAEVRGQVVPEKSEFGVLSYIMIAKSHANKHLPIRSCYRDTYLSRQYSVSKPEIAG